MKKICPQCGFMMDETIVNCPQCKHHFPTTEEIHEERLDQVMQKYLWSSLEVHSRGGEIEAWPKRNRIIAAILAIFGGALAIDDFYLGRDPATLGTHLLLSFISGGAIGIIWGVIRGIMYLTCDRDAFQIKYRVRL